MYRVALPALLTALLAGCGMSTKMIGSGFADNNDQTASIAAPRKSPSGALGGEPEVRDAGGGKAASSKEQRTAKLDDKAPAGSYEKAPRGALSDRDYSGAGLDAEQALAAINAYRREKGLKPLRLNVELTNAAKAHSRDLAKWDRISHFGSDGSNPGDRVKREGYNARLAAENVGTGQATFDEVMKGWKASPGHNKNLLLPDAQHIGVALVQDPKTEFKTFWTLVIGNPI